VGAAGLSTQRFIWTRMPRREVTESRLD
jgi:hypothetical protein